MENTPTEIVKHICAACDYDGDAVRVRGNILCPACGCPEDPMNGEHIDEDELIDYIQGELMKEGIVVTKSDLERVFLLEEEFYVVKGLVNEPDGDPPDA